MIGAAQLLTHLKNKIRNDRRQVRVAVAFANAVHGALNQCGARFDAGERYRDTETGVVVAVHPDRSGRKMGDDFAHNRIDLADEFSAIGVTECEVDRSTAFGRFERLQGIFRIVAESVKEMLRVVDDLASILCEEADGVLDHLEVFLGCGAENLCNVEEPGLPENRDHRCLCIEKKLKLRVILRPKVRASRRTEGSNLSVLEL